MKAQTLGRLRRWWDLASIYLPVLIMGLLALGSYWILRTTPAPQESSPERPVSHEPDYFMRGFSVRSHGIDGTLRSEVFGSLARHYPDSDTLEVDDARIRAFNDKGQLTTATARRLSVDSKQTQYLLEGEVRVERAASGSTEDGPRSAMNFAGEQLRLYTETHHIESDLPVELTRGRDRITADQLRYDDSKRIADLQGRVHAVLPPRSR